MRIHAVPAGPCREKIVFVPEGFAEAHYDPSDRSLAEEVEYWALGMERRIEPDGARRIGVRAENADRQRHEGGLPTEEKEARSSGSVALDCDASARPPHGAHRGIEPHCHPAWIESGAQPAQVPS